MDRHPWEGQIIGQAGKDLLWVTSIPKDEPEQLCPVGYWMRPWMMTESVYHPGGKDDARRGTLARISHESIFFRWWPGVRTEFAGCCRQGLTTQPRNETGLPVGLTIPRKSIQPIVHERCGPSACVSICNKNGGTLYHAAIRCRVGCQSGRKTRRLEPQERLIRLFSPRISPRGSIYRAVLASRCPEDAGPDVTVMHPHMFGI